MLIEIHMLKHYPASNLNRDETGAPKTCYFGGAQRGRISSQCLKRAWRTSPLFDALQSKGWRSRSLAELVGRELSDLPEEAVAHARKLVTGIANKDGKMNDREDITGQIIFFSPDDVRALAEAIREAWREAGDVKTFRKQKPDGITQALKKASARAITLDIALFGRMVTSDALVNVEAAMQVAHAVSTHAVNLESDYFTAVDDLLTGEESTGAGMIGDIDFDSCCYYQYASLDVDKLRENLKDSPEALARVDELVPVLLRVMAMSNPSGKQNSFAAHVLPDALLVEFKPERIPLSYANAFAEPVSRFSRQISRDSAEKLVEEVDRMDRCYALPVSHRAWLSLRSDRQPEKCQRFERFDELVHSCGEWAKE